MSTVDRNDDFFEQCAQQFLLVAIRGGRRGPPSLEIGAESSNAPIVFGTQCRWTQLGFAFERGSGLLEITQALFPLRFQSASHKSVLRIHGTIATLGALCFVVGPFHSQAPLCERRIVVGFELLCGLERRLKSGGLEVFKQGPGVRPIELQARRVRAIESAAGDDVLAGTIVTGPCISSWVLSA